MMMDITKDSLDLLEDDYPHKEEIAKELQNNPFAKVIIMKEQSHTIGYISYSDIYERAEINQIEIEKIHRNCGKGNLLLQKMIETVQKDITLEVREDNQYAIKLYEKNGFEKKAIRRGYYKGIDGILMERKQK